MNTIDIILIILLSASVLGAVIGSVRGRKRSCCVSCSGCQCCGGKREKPDNSQTA